MEYYSAIEKKEILPFEGIMLSEVSQRKKIILHDLPYMWSGGYQGLEGGGIGEMLVKGHKLPLIR